MEVKCPQCASLMANMGLDFKAPKKQDVKAWNHLKTLYSTGITFHSCGCSGPGYIPNTKEKLVKYFEELKDSYQEQLTFWQKHTNKQEKQINLIKNLPYIGATPAEYRISNSDISNGNAKNYWIEKIKDVEAKLKELKE